jgi:hypothetical protein
MMGSSLCLDSRDSGTSMPIESQEESISSLQRTSDGTAAGSPLNSVFGGLIVESGCS